MKKMDQTEFQRKMIKLQLKHWWKLIIAYACIVIGWIAVFYIINKFM
jgi:hypothetical protein